MELMNKEKEWPFSGVKSSQLLPPRPRQLQVAQGIFCKRYWPHYVLQQLLKGGTLANIYETDSV
jgi:hypothetical protein